MKKPSKAAKSADKIAAFDLPIKEQIRQGSFHFPVVGIGASAGGLEALEQFLRSVPADSGMAFVIVQHLDPNHKGILAEILQRATTMEVFQVMDRMKVKPDCVYVIPPNKDMSILHGLLHLFEPASPRGLRLFRDPVAWDELRSEVLPDLLANLPAGGTLRAWSAGCSTGEEAYSLAIILKEAQEKYKPARNFSTQIFATDLDTDAIDKARHGLYSAKAAEALTNSSSCFRAISGAPFLTSPVVLVIPS